MLTFLLVVHAIIAASLVAVILMQRSEGGGLTSNSTGGLISARGAADFMTRLTTILGSLFVVMSIALAALASVQRAPVDVDTSLVGKTASSVQPTQAPPADDPLAAAAAQGGDAAANSAAPAK